MFLGHFYQKILIFSQSEAIILSVNGRKFICRKWPWFLDMFLFDIFERIFFILVFPYSSPDIGRDKNAAWLFYSSMLK